MDVRQDELVSTLFLFFYFFLVTASAYIIKPVKISLFLEWLTVKKLPLAYMLTALLIGFFVTLNSKLLQRMKRELYISISLAFFIMSFLVFWWLFKIEWKWLSLVFWFWADVFTATSVTQFWILVNDEFNPRQAKRMIGFLVSGGLLGGITGALLASSLVSIIRTEDLLLACPVLLIVCLILMLSRRGFKISKGKTEIKQAEEKKREKVSYRKSFQMFAKNRHLVILGGIMASTIIVTTLIDFQFNSVVEKKFMELDTRTAFLGTFFFVLLVFSYLLHVSTTNRILKNFGIHTAILITPLILLIGTLAVFFVPITALIFWAVPLKGADKSLAHSLSQSVRELLYIPVAPDIKYKAKVFIDLFVNKLPKDWQLFFCFCFLLCWVSLSSSLVLSLFFLFSCGLGSTGG